MLYKNRLKVTRQFVQIECDRNDAETQNLCKLIPYIHRNRISTKFTTTVRNLPEVLKIFRNFDGVSVDTLPPLIKELYTKEVNRRESTQHLIKFGAEGTSNWLRPHQQLGREIAMVNDRFGFFYDTRTGKTPMSLQIIADDIAAHPEHKWLVLCPLILIENAWLEDATKFFPELSITSLHASTKAKRLKLFEKDANVYVQNIESFVSYRPYIEKLNIHGCFVDESSTMKSTKSKFGKAAVEYATGLKRWYLLSGTPAPNGEYEYYRQLQSIDFYGVHKSYSQFKQYFFNNISYNPQFEKLQLKPEKEQEFKDLVARYGMYVDKADALRLPGRDFQDIHVKMPANVKKEYDNMVRKLYVEIEHGDEKFIITAPSAAAKINKLRQLSSGFIIDADHDTTHLISMYKFNALMDFLRSQGDEQIIIWCNYAEEFNVIQKLLGHKCGVVNGRVSLQEKNKAIRLFKEGKLQYLVANPASADKGLTLTMAHICIYFSLTHSYEYYTQSMDRIYGDIMKQPKKCHYYHLIVDGSVDGAIKNTLSNKEDASYAILNYIRKEGNRNGATKNG